MNNYDKIVKYLKDTKIFNKQLVIPGWFNINDILCFYIISSIQKLNDINGNATEIGVHYGKCSIFLSNLYYDKIFSVDIFDDKQYENISNSGNGNLQMFKQLLNEYGIIEKVNIIVKNSMDLTIEDTFENTLFHIDGGHSFKEVMSDLNIAKNTTKTSGVIILDDAFSYKYPDVAMAISLFLNENKDFVPFLITSGKLYLCNKEYFDFYYSFFENINNLKAFGFQKNDGHAKTLLDNKITIISDKENMLFKNNCELIDLLSIKN